MRKKRIYPPETLLQYEAVTADEKETPCFTGSAKEMAAFLGIREDSFRCGICRRYKKQKGYRIYPLGRF